MGWYLDGRVTAVVGTHTHVPTADARVLPKGTAYISDIGMTGPRDSIIGFSLETVLPRFLTHLPTRFNVAEGPVSLNAVVDRGRARDRAGALDRAGAAPDRGLAGCRTDAVAGHAPPADPAAAGRHRRPDRLRQDRSFPGPGRAPAARDPGRRFAPGVPRHGHRHRQARCGRASTRCRITCWTWPIPMPPSRVADWVAQARPLVPEIWARGRLPLVVGGTGLYVSALVDGLRPRLASRGSPRCAASWPSSSKQEGHRALAARLEALDPTAAARTDLRNPRRVLRALERAIARRGSERAADQPPVAGPAWRCSA